MAPSHLPTSPTIDAALARDVKALERMGRLVRKPPPLFWWKNGSKGEGLF
jgi:hypothetical protein